MDFISKDKTSFVVVDVQERLMGAMPEDVARTNVKNIKILLEAAKILDIPVTVTEQYPKGLGPTIQEVRESVDNFSPIEKVVFSCVRSPEFESAINEINKREVLLCGVETHVCVLQTAIDLINKGYSVYVPADAVISRRRLDWEKGMSLIERSGATIGTMEAFVFQLLERAGTDEFKSISRLVR